MGADRPVVTNYPHGETITVKRRTAGAPDGYGNPTYTWSTSTIANVPVFPRAGGEDNADGRQGVIAGLTIYPPHGSAIGPHDLVNVYGEDYRIVGEPGSWKSPFTGWAPCMEIDLERVEG